MRRSVTTVSLLLQAWCLGTIILVRMTNHPALGFLVSPTTSGAVKHSNLPKNKLLPPQKEHRSTTSTRVILAMSEKPKETTWDRITGPKLFKTVTKWEGIHSVPLVPLRILTGLLMIHHGSEGTFTKDFLKSSIEREM
jgi:hypothetical protein